MTTFEPPTPGITAHCSQCGTPNSGAARCHACAGDSHAAKLIAADRAAQGLAPGETR